MNALAPAKFKPRRHYNKALSDARDMGFRGATLNILRFLCWEAEFNRPFVTRYQADIANETGHDPTTVKRSIRQLREAGILIPVANPRGGQGRNRPTTFKIWANWTKGGSEAPANTENEDTSIKGGASRPKRGGLTPEKGGPNTPTTHKTINSIRDNVPAGRGEGGFAAIASTLGTDEEEAQKADDLRWTKRHKDLMAGGMDPMKAFDQLDREKKEEALRAAENEEGEKSEMENAE